MEMNLISINELSKLIIECLDYEEDLNIKEDSYEKFEIKPTFIPNIKKFKSRDKTINLDFMSEFCEKLFDVHAMMNKLSLKQ